MIMNMKKIIYVMVVALLSINSFYAYSQPSKVVKRITSRIDSVDVGTIADSLNSILNDTIKFGTEEVKSIAADPDNNFSVVVSGTEIGKSEADIAKISVISSFIFFLLVIIAALITGYMRRRAKYKLIEKAIENNYALPEYLFNKRIDEQWGSLKSGIVWTAVGIGLMIAFDDSFMSGVFLIVLLIGFGKIAIWMLNKREENRAKSKSVSVPMPPSPPMVRDNVENNNSVNSNNEPDNVK